MTATQALAIIGAPALAVLNAWFCARAIRKGAAGIDRRRSGAYSAE